MEACQGPWSHCLNVGITALDLGSLVITLRLLFIIKDCISLHK